MAKNKGNDLFELKSGVVLRLKRLDPWLIRTVTNQIKPPQVPKQFIEEKGREEENPTHPAYLAAMQEYDNELSRLVQHTSIAMGTEIASLPRGFDKPEDMGWQEHLEAAGLAIENTPAKRYVQWIQFWAMADDIVGQMTELCNRLFRQWSVREEDAATAADNFRGNEERNPDLATRHKGASRNGNKVRASKSRPGSRL